MAYTTAEFTYYKKNPTHITAELASDLLEALIDHDAENIKHIKPQTFEQIKRAYAVSSSAFKFCDLTKVTIQFLEKVVSENPTLIQHIYYPSKDVMKIALAKDLNVLVYIEKYLDDDMYNWLLSQNGLILEFIPAGKQTEELVLTAIRENLEAYKYANVKTKATDMYVIQQDPTKVSWISFYWPELIEEIISYNPRYLTKFLSMEDVTVPKDIIKLALNGAPELYRAIPNPDVDLMKYAIKLDIDLFQYMPYNQEVLEYALETNGLVLKYIKKKDLRTIKLAIQQNVKALDYVPYPRQFLIDYAFKQNGLALKYLKNPTYEQSLDAVKRAPAAIEFVPDNHITTELQLYALMGGTSIVPLIKQPVDDEVTNQILVIDPTYIFKITSPTESMYMIAFGTEGRLIMYYDDWNTRFSIDVITAALKSDGTIFEFVVNKSKTYAMAAISDFPAALQWVTGIQDLEMCYEAISKDPRTIKFVDRSLLNETMLDMVLAAGDEFFSHTEGEMTWEEWLKINGVTPL